MAGAGGASLPIRSHGSPLNKGRHGRGLRSALQRLRLRLGFGCISKKSSSSTPSQNRKSSLRLAMRPFKSRAKQPKKRRDSASNGSRDTTDVAPPPQPSTHSTPPGLFARILRRAHSKTSLKPRTSRSASRAYPPISNDDEVTSPVYAPDHLAPSQLQQEPQSLQFLPDHSKTSLEHNKISDASVPRDAPLGFSRIHDSPGGAVAYYHSSDEDERRIPSARAAPSHRPRTSDSSHQARVSDSNGNERPTTAATADTLDEPIETNVERINSEPREKTSLQAPPAPSQRQREHSSQKLTIASRTATEKFSPSDYQNFMQQAKDVEEREKEALWRTISSRSKHKSFVPNHPDLNMNLSSLERSGTFGGSKKSAHKSQNSGSVRQGANYASPTDDRRMSYAAGGDTLNTDLITGNRGGGSGRKMSATKLA